MDLLISSLRLTKMAKLEHPVFVPVIGNDPYDLANKSLMTAAECREFPRRISQYDFYNILFITVYISKEKKLVVLQIRSLLVKVNMVKCLSVCGLAFLTLTLPCRPTVLTSCSGSQIGSRPATSSKLCSSAAATATKELTAS